MIRTTIHWHEAVRLYEEIHGKEPGLLKQFQRHGREEGFHVRVFERRGKLKGFAYGISGKAVRTEAPWMLPSDWYMDDIQHTFFIMQVQALKDEKEENMEAVLIRALAAGPEAKRIALVVPEDDESLAGKLEALAWEKAGTVKKPDGTRGICWIQERKK
ncbi:hypothetical protein [Alkalicoccus chagannorensis]|uniref:hypothetical protein n=1 Tax=Alkalicoccus chagannorensis TaxID=427072 RepID=UPI00047E3E3C|nr:hypothetical protein [Alkalicoccus chagannorensis]